MTDPKHGDVILYSYLWAREHERGEETNKAARAIAHPTTSMCRVIPSIAEAAGSLPRDVAGYLPCDRHANFMLA